jgi:hypothetical protein
MRNAERHDLRVCAAVKVVEVGSQEKVPIVTRNLSQGGMFLVTKARWSPDSVVTFRISHRYWEAAFKAKVVHTRPDGVGFAFVGLDDATREMVRRIIDGLLADGAWYDDRRRSIRTQIEGTVVWRYSKVEIESRLRDLTPEGAFIITSEPPEIGAHIYFYVPGELVGSDGTRSPEARGAQATVVRREPQGFAVEFVFPSDEFGAAVRNLLETAGRQQG